ncbi:MAG: aconitate hydratase AcnA, partial [Betaproteobacteria bacterium]|nr:aconitate hydratase AcnA [Betaproteobacteria bacterium]
MARVFDSSQTLRDLTVDGKLYHAYSLPAAEDAGLGRVTRLPYTLKVMLENLLRQHAAGTAMDADVCALADWLTTRGSEREIGFKPTRVMMPDSSGIPLVGDMAAMRDAMVRLGGDPRRINPLTPVDFIIDHAVTVDYSGTPEAAQRNMALEIERNRERYEFLRWGQQAFDNLRLIPPGSGICHQINLEYLARVVWTREEAGRTLAYPDSLLGMDSHTAMINSLGVIGWGVGGFEGGMAALGEPVPMQIPEVVGCRLHGKLNPGVTSTDLVLSVTQIMRRHKLIGKFVEFFGPGVDELSLPDRATIANMTPEYGATMGFFPVDRETLRYLALTGRDAHQIALVEAYTKAQGLWRDAQTPVPDYTAVVDIDLASVEPCVAGPKRPHERVPLAQAPQAFRAAHPANGEAVTVPGADYRLKNGDVVVAAITSCTNTSNPSVMVAAGLLARNAVARGLTAKPWVKTSLSPGSRVVADYLARSHLAQPLDQLGFNIVGYLVDLANEPIGAGRDGQPVFLKDIWPDPAEVRALIHDTLSPEVFRSRYATIEEGAPEWRSIGSGSGVTFAWQSGSTFIRRPPFFDDMQREPAALSDIRGARVLAMFGDMLTTDHISPIATISPGTPAAEYLESLGIAPQDFVSYGARRLNHDVMTRGAFANIRIQNEMVPGVEGSAARHWPSGETLSIFDAAARYRRENVPLVVVGGAEYGAGSSRDWAAKGTRLLGIRAV